MNELNLYSLGAGLPICAVCNRPVDKVESTYSPLHDGKLFRVTCHGKTEEQMLSAFTMIEAHEITFGKAFDTPKLEGGQP
jgi:hypothetical protein